MNIFKTVLKKWYLYVIAIGLSIFGCSYYVNFINMPRNEQTISLFISSYTSDTSKVKKYLESKSPSYLREIDITNIQPDSSNLEYFFVNKGLNRADIFILHESLLTKELLENQFAMLDNDYLSNYFSYESEATNHGIVVHKKDGEDHKLITFKKDGKDDQNFYLFFRINSLHIGKLNNSNYDTAINLTKAILEYE